MESENILTFDVVASDTSRCVSEISASIVDGHGPATLACFNPHSYAMTLKRPLFSGALRSVDWLVPDGIGVVIGSRILGGGIRERLTGSSIFFDLHKRLNDTRGATVFLLGGTNSVLAKIIEKMSDDWSEIEVVGFFSPEFKDDFSDEDLLEMAERVNSKKPDILWIGMGAPKQEECMHRLAPLVDVKFIAAVGAVFDFYADEVKRSSPVFRRLGLEWFPRLLQEPTRLWRRMFISAPIFIWHVIKARFGYHPRH